MDKRGGRTFAFCAGYVNGFYVDVRVVKQLDETRHMFEFKRLLIIMYLFSLIVYKRIEIPDRFLVSHNSNA